MLASAGMLRMVPAPLHEDTDQCFCEVVEPSPDPSPTSGLSMHAALRGLVKQHTAKWLTRLGVLGSGKAIDTDGADGAIPRMHGIPPEFERGGVHHGRTWSAMRRRVPAAALADGIQWDQRGT